VKNAPAQYLLFALLSLCPSRGAAETAVLFDVGDASMAGRYQLSDARAVSESTENGKCLRITFGCRAPYPNIRFEPKRAGFVADWSQWGALSLTLLNPSDKPLTIGLRIDSLAASDRGRQATTEIAPRQEKRVLMPLRPRASITGMIGQPPIAGTDATDFILNPTDTAFDAAKIRSFQLFVGKPKHPSTVVLKRAELRAMPDGPKVPFVDRFGQFNGASWPGKLESESDFGRRREQERAAIAKLPAIPGRSAFGGWAAGPRLEATGRFRVQKEGARWWLVDPEGRLFWSSGVTGVRLNNATQIASRENFFEWLPRQGDPQARFFGGGAKNRTFDFFASNLLLKYGPEFEREFFDISTRRLVSWGFNTIANWSDERSWALHRVPYTVPVQSGGPTFVVAERLKAGKPWVRSFPDPFDPAFSKRLDARLAALAHLKDDPWLLGVFIDNELPWIEGSPPRRLAAAALALPANRPVKAALLKRLRSSNASPAALNAIFGTHFASWEEADRPWALDAAQLKNAETALAGLDAAIAEQYFRTCRDALGRHLPGALYLGCRFHTYNREAIATARKYCDVVSFNIYGYSPSERAADEHATEMDFPAIIGEFHFGATDRGMFHPGLRRTENQADRAKKFSAYMGEAAAAPWCVGAHWFQYLDQPLTGRGDGENYNIGFINATDDPYPELSEAAREFHTTLYKKRSAGGLISQP